MFDREDGPVQYLQIGSLPALRSVPYAQLSLDENKHLPTFYMLQDSNGLCCIRPSKILAYIKSLTGRSSKVV